MISVTVGKNIDRKTVLVDEATETPRQVLENNNVDYATGVTTLDGSPMQPGDMDKTFQQLGITNKCYLFSVVKTNNA